MNWEAVSAIAEILGLIILIITVIYLAIQVRDGNKIAQAQALQTVLDSQRDRSIIPWINNPEICDVFATGLNSCESLNASDKRRFFLTLTEMAMQMQNVMQLYEKNLISDVEYKTWLSFTASIVTTPGGREMWELIKVQLTPTVVRAMDDYILASPELPSLLDINPLFREEK